MRLTQQERERLAFLLEYAEETGGRMGVERAEELDALVRKDEQDPMLFIVIESLTAMLNDDSRDPDLIPAAFRRIADHIEGSGGDDGTLAQFFEDVALDVEGKITREKRGLWTPR